MNRTPILAAVLASTAFLAGCAGGTTESPEDTYLTILEADDLLNKFDLSGGEALLLGEEICKDLDLGWTQNELIEHMDEISVFTEVDATIFVLAAEQNLCENS